MSDHPFRVRDLEPIQPGETIPDKVPTRSSVLQWFEKRTPPETIQATDNLAHLPQFEKLREKINDAKRQVNDAKIESAKFESEVVEQRRKFETEVEKQRGHLRDDIEDAERLLNTLDDHAQQYVKSVWPEKMLVDDPHSEITAPDLPTHLPMETIEEPS